MKIGFDAKRYFFNQTGLGNYSRWLINGLNQNSSDTFFLYSTQKKQNPNPRLIVKSSSNKRLSSLWRSWLITRTLQRDHIDIYHGLSNELPFGIHRISTKTVVTIHDLIHKRYPKNYAWIDRKIYNLKLKYTIKHADLIITVSQQTKKDILHYFPTEKSKIKVIPIGINTQIRTIKSQQVKPYVLCVSSFSKRKNLLILIDAFKKITSKSIQLVIAGAKGDLTNSIIKKAAQDPRISLHFNVTDLELSQLYYNCKFCVYPSLYEGFGMPIMEAFNYGKTVATSNISSMPEVGQNAALYFNPKDVNSIQETIQKLLVDELRIKLESKIPNALKKFNTKLLIQEYIKTYDELMTTK